MKIKDRLIRIITSEGLTSAAFADSIGVQRSSISHIISGRNKPSLDFLQKILASFPKYNAEWLVMGIGDVYKHPTQANLFDTQAPKSGLNDENKPINELTPSNPSESTPIQQNLFEQSKNDLNEENEPVYQKPRQTLESSNAAKNKKLHKIVLFYDDKSFSEYAPE